METRNLWFVTAAAAVLTATTMLTSCNKDNLEPTLPEVIESEVYQGQTGEVTAEVGTEGTQLSYESWIMVRGTTRSTFDNKVSVTLNNRLENVTEVLTVTGWNMGEQEISIEKKGFTDKKEGFVSITDSTLLYEVKFREFSFFYQLHYQVPVYDDGVTRQVMPHYSYKNIRNNSSHFEELDSYVDGNVAYARRIYHHSILVDFGDKTYEVKAEVTLRRELGPASEPYIVKSKILQKFADRAKFENGDYGFWASFMVSQKMSTGESFTDSHTAFFPAKVMLRSNSPATFHGQPSDLNLQSAEFISAGSYSYYDVKKYLKAIHCQTNYMIYFSGFDISMEIDYYTSVFDNGVIYDELPFFDPKDIKVRLKDAKWDFIETSNNIDYYNLVITLEVTMGILSVDEKVDQGVSFKK